MARIQDNTIQTSSNSWWKSQFYTPIFQQQVVVPIFESAKGAKKGGIGCSRRTHVRLLIII